MRPANVSPRQVTMGGRARIERQRIEEHVGQLESCQVLGISGTRRKNQPLRGDAPLMRFLPQVVLNDLGLA
jgi:hypothetical protein